MKNLFKTLLMFAIIFAISCQPQEFNSELNSELNQVESVDVVIEIQTENEYLNNIQGRRFDDDFCNYWVSSYTDNNGGLPNLYPITGWPNSYSNKILTLSVSSIDPLTNDLGLYYLKATLTSLSGEANGGRAFIGYCRMGGYCAGNATQDLPVGYMEYPNDLTPDNHAIQVQVFYNTPLINSASATYKFDFFIEVQNGCQIFINSQYITVSVYAV